MKQHLIRQKEATMKDTKTKAKMKTVKVRISREEQPPRIFKVRIRQDQPQPPRIVKVMISREEQPQPPRIVKVRVGETLERIATSARIVKG